MADKPRAFLGMPGCGRVEMGAARAYFRPTLGRLDVHCCYQSSSLINANCNALWAAALTNRARGKRLDFFAMLHSDVQPRDGWLDVLVGEMEDKGLDLLAAAVPIKDTRGLTSTAVGSGDPFRPLCRLTMRELFDLPETFTLDDLGIGGATALLFNTGCWVCRFDPAWAAGVWFETQDRVEWDAAGDRYAVLTEPEDWGFARKVAALGLRVGVTRKVPLGHVGGFVFESDSPWGEFAFDEEYTDSPLVARPLPAGVP